MSTNHERAVWLRGGTVKCEKKNVEKAYRVVLLGAPGVGKGTQAELLTQRLGPCQLSTGDIFRAAKSLPASERTPAMEAALGYMSRGELVPDETVLNLVRERVECLRCQSGFLLDGFPRTVAQAEALGQILKQENIQLDAVLCFEMPIDKIVARLSGRRTCSQCKAVYHVTNRPPKAAGVCDNCGGELIQREDDRPESVRVRMETYQKSTAPLIDYYQKLNLLRMVPAEGQAEEVYQRTMAALNSKPA